MTIPVYYSCPRCGLRDHRVEVPMRGDEDVVTWFDQMVKLLEANHFTQMPQCHAKVLMSIKIPVTGANRIGGTTLQ